MKIIEFLTPLWDTLKGILPIALILIFLQTVLLKKPIEEAGNLIIGLVMTVLGLHFFLKGAYMSLIPLGENVGRNLYILDKRFYIILVGFIIGYCGTLVEPALKSMAMELEEISVGVVRSKTLIQFVAVGFGIGMSLGLFRIISGIQFVKLLVPLLLTIAVLSLLTPEPFRSIAMDSASATTGPVNIPLNMALAVGLSSVVANADPLLSGLGIVGLTSLTTMIAVMILGIISKF